MLTNLFNQLSFCENEIISVSKWHTHAELFTAFPQVRRQFSEAAKNQETSAFAAGARLARRDADSIAARP
jgi:hypothetical protein